MILQVQEYGEEIDSSAVLIRHNRGFASIVHRSSVSCDQITFPEELSTTAPHQHPLPHPFYTSEVSLRLCDLSQRLCERSQCSGCLTGFTLLSPSPLSPSSLSPSPLSVPD